MKPGLILALLALSGFPLSCTNAASPEKPYRSIHEIPRGAELVLPSGQKLRTQLALTIDEQSQGLSGIQSKDYRDDQGMLFLYSAVAPRSFWMPDTYFNLDIFFLDRDLTIVDVEREVPFHPGRSQTPRIPATRTIYSFHVLEIRSSSPLAKSLKKGDRPRWSSTPSLETVLTSIKDKAP